MFYSNVKSCFEHGFVQAGKHSSGSNLENCCGQSSVTF